MVVTKVMHGRRVEGQFVICGFAVFWDNIFNKCDFRISEMGVTSLIAVKKAYIIGFIIVLSSSQLCPNYLYCYTLFYIIYL